MAATIEILSNTRCHVTGLSDGLLRDLDAALAMPIPGARYSPRVRSGFWDGKKHLFYKATCNFPRGLLQRVQALLDEAKVTYTVDDLRKRPALAPVALDKIKPGMLKGITLRAYQVEAARRALAAERGILWLATNAGKTEVACAMMKVLKECHVLFLVHKKALLNQTISRIAERLGTIEEHIGRVGDGCWSPKRITVATIQTLARKGARHEAAKRLLKETDVLFVDEGHHTRSNTWYAVCAMCPAQFRYILSGTPFGSGNGLMVEAAVGPVVARVSNGELIDLGVSAMPTIEMLPVEEPVIDPLASWEEVYKEGIVTNTARNGMIAEKARGFAKEKKPTLILIRELWHGDLIREALEALKVKCSFVHGEMPISRVEHEKARFEDGKIPVLIASPIFDEGIDVPAIKALIVADGGKSVRATLQKIGRGLRQKDGENVLAVVDFADLTHRWLSRHSLDRIAIYEEEGFSVK